MSSPGICILNWRTYSPRIDEHGFQLTPLPLGYAHRGFFRGGGGASPPPLLDVCPPPHCNEQQVVLAPPGMRKQLLFRPPALPARPARAGELVSFSSPFILCRLAAQQLMHPYSHSLVSSSIFVHPISHPCMFIYLFIIWSGHGTQSLMPYKATFQFT